MITDKLIAEIKIQFRINWDGRHGIRHWARVYDIGMKLSEVTSANVKIVQLFSIFHDSCRHNEFLDSKHGPRGAELAVQMRKVHLSLLTAEEFDLLHQACRLHTKASTHENITVQTCFDADRLDLGRVGTVPKAKYLCTDAGKSEDMINWAYQNSVTGFVPNNRLGSLVG